jgi:hypothetical protein
MLFDGCAMAGNPVCFASCWRGRVVAMSIGGWKTAPMFRRYAIVSQSDQKAAVEKLEQQRREISRQATLENRHDFSHDSASDAQVEAEALKARLN